MGLSILVFSAGCYALEVFPLDQVVPGLVGVGKTVIQGREIKEFAVEVLGVVPQSPPTPDLILVRLSGDVIDQVGGIASGMSGSPVYVDGALLGAISYGYSLSDHRICLITPAQAMFELLDRIALQAGGEQSYPELPHDVVALSAPLVVNGIRGRALEYLRSSLRDLRFAVEPGLAHSVDVVPAVLEPGSAFAVQLLA